MGDIRSWAIRELFRELFHPAKAVGFEYWFCKKTFALTVTAILLIAFWGLFTLTFGEAKRNISGVATRRPPNSKATPVQQSAGRFGLVRPSTVDKWTCKGHDGKWSNPKNWSLMTIPEKTNDVIVPGNTCTSSVDASSEISNLTIQAGGAVKVPEDHALFIYGDSILNSGQMKLDGSIGGQFGGKLYLQGSTVTLSGSASLYMSDNPHNAIIGESGIFENKLTQPADIEGAGGIRSHGRLQLTNFGTINATSPDNPLTIGRGAGDRITNDGILESTNGILLLLGKYKNSGSIEANGGTVLLSGCTIVGGTLNTSGGIINPDPALEPTLDGVTNQGFYQLNSGSSTILKGTITNDGQFQMNDTKGKDTSLLINGTATLTGSGVVTVSAGFKNKITGTGTLTNKQKIQGPMTIDVAKFNNSGTVQTLSSNFPLTIQTLVVTNSGTIAATSGPLNIFGSTVENNGGYIKSDSTLTLDGGTIVRQGNLIGGGVVEGKNAKVEGQKKDAWDSPASAVTNAATFLINAGDTTIFQGGFINNGIVEMTAIGCQTCSNATAVISGNVNLTGTGAWKLESLNGFTGVITGETGNDTLTNSSTIQGTGVIGNKSMNLVNAAKGQIVANSSLPLVISMGSGNIFTNNGPLVVAAIGGQSPSVLTLTGPFANFNPNTGTLTGGIFNIAGTFQFDNANIVNNAANLTLAGRIINQNNVNALLNFANNTSRGSVTLLPPTFNPLATAGTFTNQGQFTISKWSKFTVGGSGNYQQAGGRTTVDGTLAVPTGSQVNATAGTLAGAGTFSGNVSVGNASGKVASLIVGDTTKQSAQISATNDYTQLLTGVLDVQIGGTTVGSQYSQLNVTSAANLNGTLNIKLINKFLPSVGQTFNILTSSSLNGTFSKVNGKKINSSEHFEVSYSSTEVVLTVVSGSGE